MCSCMCMTAANRLVSSTDRQTRRLDSWQTIKQTAQLRVRQLNYKTGRLTGGQDFWQTRLPIDRHVDRTADRKTVQLTGMQTQAQGSCQMCRQEDRTAYRQTCFYREDSYRPLTLWLTRFCLQSRHKENLRCNLKLFSLFPWNSWMVNGQTTTTSHH